ncbi:MAG: hypothetical protein K0R39_17 [Symbiobacteriaceae bacterium]|jgi:hypothetical protein|nr:hypothetical protein [Symbiobacteriaceae bacterium]
MNANRQTAEMSVNNQEGNMMTTPASLIRMAGLSAMVAGILFVVIQPFHPSEILSSVTTGAWATVHYLTIAMSLFGLFGVTGIYARQVKETGWLGLAGYLIMSLWLLLTTAFTFAEAFIMPVLATDAPQFVEGFIGIFSGAASEANLGVLPAAGPISFVLYLLGGLLFGIATLRARILSRWAAGVLAAGALFPLAASLLPHPLDRLAAVPVGLGLAWLGYSLWSERRAKVLAE